MDDASLTGHVREHILDSAYYIVSAIRRYSDDLISQVPDVEQIRCDLVVIFVRGKAIEDGPPEVLRAVNDEAMVIRVICPVNEKIYGGGRVYRPGWPGVKIVVEPPVELARAVAARDGDLFYGHPARHPLLEPHKPVR
jgi:hypothetical protein